MSSVFHVVNDTQWLKLLQRRTTLFEFPHGSGAFRPGRQCPGRNNGEREGRDGEGDRVDERRGQDEGRELGLEAGETSKTKFAEAATNGKEGDGRDRPRGRDGVHCCREQRERFH